VKSVALALLTLGLIACTPRPDPAVAAEVQKFDAELQKIRDAGRKVSSPALTGERDFRGVTYLEDIDRWVPTRETTAKLQLVRKRALSAASVAEAQALLSQGRAFWIPDAQRGNDIARYWTGQMPAPYWHRRWQSFFDANAIPVPAPDARLLEIEQRMRVELDAGNFARANVASADMVNALRVALDTAGRDLAQQRAGTKPAFTPRRSACVPGGAFDPWRDHAKIVRGDSVDRFYPAASMARGEEGSVVLRVLVDGAGCGTSVAIMVHSGVEALDAAALQWFETAQFSAAAIAGRPAESQLSFKVLFRLQDAEL
jgi:TonB family protein